MHGGGDGCWKRTQGTEVKSAIVGIVHIRDGVFIATRDRSLLRYPLQLSGAVAGTDHASMANFVNENVVRLFKMRGPGMNFLVVQGTSRLFFLREDLFPKREMSPIPDLKNIKCCAVYPNGNLMAAADSQNLYLIGVTREGVLGVGKKVQHTMKGIVNIVAAGNSLLMYDKKEFKLLDLEFKPQQAGKLSKPIKLCAGIQGTNGFLAVVGNQVKQIGEKVLRSELSFPEEVSAFAVRVPYVYGLAQNVMYVSTTVAALNGSVQLQTKAKNLLIEVLDNYSVVCAADSQWFVIRYTRPEADIDKLTEAKDWESAIELCKSLKSNTIDNDQLLSGLYHRYSDNLFSLGEYRKAFQMFRKSGRPPSDMIRKYKRLLQVENFRSLAEADLSEYMRLTRDLMNLLNDNAPPSKVLDAMGKVKNHAGDRTKLPEASVVLKSRDTFIQQCRNDLSDADKMLTEIQDLFDGFAAQSRHPSTEADVELSELLKESLRTEKQPTRIKIYNTILVECYAGAAMLPPLEKFLESEPPLFFDVAAKALSTKYEEAFLHLCSQHHKHDAALKYLRDLANQDHNYDRFIAYIRESSDCIQLATNEFMKLFETFTAKGSTMDTDAAAEKAVQVFLSKNLKLEDVEYIMNVIEKLDLKDIRSPITKDVMEIKILEFAVNELKIKRMVIHKKLIDLYLDVLRQKNGGLREMSKYTRIEEETDPFVKKTRLGLLHLLDTSESYTPSEVCQMIDNWLLEEKLAAMRKANMISKCIDECLKPKVDFQVALDFCDKVYRRDDVTRSGVYDELFTKLMQQKSDLDKIKRLLNERAVLLDPEKIVENIPDMPLFELKEYLSRSSLERINRLRSLKIRNALLAMTIETKKRQRRYLQSGRVEVKENLKCVVCGKPIGESVFYVLADNCVAHAACNPNHQ